MSDTHEAHVPDQHGDDHGQDTDGRAQDAHGHDDQGLGPIDWTMWGAGVLGAGAALIVTAGFVVATRFAFNA